MKKTTPNSGSPETLLQGDEDSPAGDFRSLGPPVTSDGEGLRADDFLAKRYPFLSREKWQDRLRSGEVLLSGRVVKPSYRLRVGDHWTMYHPLEREPEVDDNVVMLWERSGVMAVCKPGNLPMHENGAYRTRHLTRVVHDRFGPEWSPVHRLDLETSGIVLCGATPELRRHLATGFEERHVEKIYLAIANGRAAESDWNVDGPIGDLAESRIRIKKWVVPDGQPARTYFRARETTATHTLLEAKPLTGRTNQIRIHAAWSGHWLVGEKLYHPDEGVFLEYWEKGGTTPAVAERAGFHRCCLHAAFLAFNHPEDKRREEVDCPLPPDMAELWQRLR
jgi:23S rRNA pseudouridine1911/1915/1917 synthase